MNKIKSFENFTKSLIINEEGPFKRHTAAEVQHHLKQSEPPKTYDQSKDDFEMSQKSILASIDELIEEYNDFTMDVSPRNWRANGHHLSELRKMKTDIKNFQPISVEEKDNDWVKNQRQDNTRDRKNFVEHPDPMISDFILGS